MRRAVGIALFIAMAALGLYVYGKPPTPVVRSRPTEAPEDAARAILKKVTLKFDWRKGGFGNIMLIDATIKNENAFDVKDLSISCEGRGASGTLITRTEQVIYQTVKSKSSRTIKNINLGFMDPQTATASCSIDDLKPELAFDARFGK